MHSAYDFFDVEWHRVLDPWTCYFLCGITWVIFHLLLERKQTINEQTLASLENCLRFLIIFGIKYILLLPLVRSWNRALVMLLPLQQNKGDSSASWRFIFQYNIRSYPTTILYNNSIPHQFTGHHTAADLVEFVEVSKSSGSLNRARTVLKSPWILREVLEKSLNAIFPWKVLKFLCKSLESPWIPFFLDKSLNFCASPWIVVEFSSTMNVVAWKEFFDAFWLSKTEYKS